MHIKSVILAIGQYAQMHLNLIVEAIFKELLIQIDIIIHPRQFYLLPATNLFIVWFVLDPITLPLQDTPFYFRRDLQVDCT